MPSNSNFSSTEGALKLRTNSPYSVMSRFSRSPPLQKRKHKTYQWNRCETTSMLLIVTIKFTVKQMKIEKYCILHQTAKLHRKVKTQHPPRPE